MDSIGWFDGDACEAMRKVSERNIVFMVYIGKGNDDFNEVFKDPIIIQLLNNELILCYHMNIASQSFSNFKEMFDDIGVPSIYMLERSNKQQCIIKINDLMGSPVDVQLDLKRRLLNAIQCIIKSFADTANVDDKQKYLKYLNNINTKLQIYNNPKPLDVEKEVSVVKKSYNSARIKIKIPSKEIVIVQDFPITSSLNDVKTFVLNNYSLPNGPLKCIAHRQFLDEDFSKTLDELELCPSSTIYFHIVPSNSLTNYRSWFGIFYSTIVKPFNVFLHFVMRIFGLPPPPAEYPTISPNTNHANKKSTRKPVSNIHQLKHINPDDNDENNTYNGNSTQQM